MDRDKPEEKESDVKIIQDTQIASQIVKQIMGSSGGGVDKGIVINILTVGQVTNTYCSGKEETPRNNFVPSIEELSIENKNLLSILDKLPGNKLDAITRFVIETSLKKFGSQAEAAEYLGVSRRVMTYQKKMVQSHKKLLQSIDQKKLGTGNADPVIDQPETSFEPTEETLSYTRSITERNKEIIETYGTKTAKEIAKTFGLSIGSVYKIVNKRGRHGDEEKTC